MTGTIPTHHIILLQALRHFPSQVAALGQALGPTGWEWPPAPGQWTFRQTVAHLAAADPPFEQRLARILAEDNPTLPRFGPETARPESPLSAFELLVLLRHNRERLLALVAEQPPEAWARPATHETLGPTTFEAQVRNISHHDAEHLQALQTVCALWPQHAQGAPARP